jgi:hypothetical protein
MIMKKPNLEAVCHTCIRGGVCLVQLGGKALEVAVLGHLLTLNNRLLLLVNVKVGRDYSVLLETFYQVRLHEYSTGIFFDLVKIKYEDSRATD